jgi:hypothetical protein
VAAVANGVARDANHRRETKHGLEAVGVGGRAETAHQQPLHLLAQGAAGLSMPNFALFERTLQVSNCGIALLSQKTAGDEIAHALVLNHTHAVGKHRTAIFRIGAGAAVTCARQTSQVGGRAGAVPQFRGGGAFAMNVFDEIERIWK